MAKILVVDDNEASRETLQNILSSAGHETVIAKEGREALAIFMKQKPDLVITDLEMPVMDGFALSRLIRGDRSSAHIPIIFISTARDISSKIKAMETGGNDYIARPFDSDELLYKVKAMLRTKALYEELRESESKFRALFEQAAVGVAQIVSETGRFFSVNKKYCDILGFSREEISNLTFQKITHREDLQAYEENMKLLMSGKIREFAMEQHNYRKDGSIVWVNLTVSPMWNIGETPDYHIIVAEEITEKKRIEEQLKVAAITDDLTGLYNRRGFYTLSEKLCKIGDRTKRQMSLLYLDLNNMKKINDELGHKVGDQALIDTANILKETFRRSDIIARMGGDEFAVLLTEQSSHDVEEVILRRLHENVKKHNQREGLKHSLSISIGVSHFDPKNSCSVDRLLKQANFLMYEEKKKYKEKHP